MTRRRVAIVVQRCHPSVVGGSEALAWQYAQLLSGEFDVEILTSTAVDYLWWQNAVPAGEDRRENIVVRRFPVEIGRTRYWFELHRRLLDRWRATSGRPPAERVRWRRALQEEFIRFQGPYCPGLTRWLADRHERYDAVLFCTYLYPTTYFAAPAVPRAKRIFVPTLHDEPTAYLSAYAERASDFDHVVWLTESERRTARALWGRDDGIVAGMAVEHDEPAPPAEWPRPYFLYAGRIEQGKGVHELLDAFRRFRRRTGLRHDLLLTGVRNMRLPFWRRDVRFLGFADEARKLSLMAGATAFVLPSQYESFSIVTMEAMAQGTPVLVNGACDVLAEHIERSGAGIAYRGIEDLAGALERLARAGPAERGAWGQAGRAYVRARYATAEVAGRLAEYVNRVADRAAGASP